MKHTTPTIALLTLAAASAVAQSAALQTQASPNFSVGVEYFDVSSDTLDYNGYGISGQAKVAGPVSLALSYRDASSDSFDVFGFGDGDLDATRFSFGVVSSHGVGSGTLNFGVAYAMTDLEGSVVGFGSGDIAENKQIVLSLSYDVALSGGLGLSFGLTHFRNDAEASDNLGGGDLDLDDVTAPSVTLSYSPSKAVTLHVSYSTEDVALGIPEADGTLTFGVRANF